MVGNILVAVDGSDHARKAVEFAADLAEKYGAKVMLLHVMTSPGSNRVPEELEALGKLEQIRITEHEILYSAAEKVLETAENQVRSRVVKELGAAIKTGDPAGEILKYASKNGVDLIMMGSRGLGHLQGLLMGSVSHKVSHLAECTCITVK